MRMLVVACLLSWCSPSWGGESRAVAALLSAALPGAGQAYLGWRSSAEAFLIAESVVWGGRYYLDRRAAGAEDEYVAYGALHASSDPTSRDDAYYDDMTKYWNAERANQHYQDPYRYTGVKVWAWRTSEERDEFTSLVRKRRQWDSGARNVLAVAILTRAAAVVHCLKAGRPGGPIAVFSHPSEVGLSVRW